MAPRRRRPQTGESCGCDPPQARQRQARPALTAPRALKEVREPIGAILDGEDHVSGRGIAHNTRQPLWRTETVGQVIEWQEGLVAA
jgi:hypothetical protein